MGSGVGEGRVLSEQLLSALAEGVVVRDRSGAVRFINDAALELLGLRAGQARRTEEGPPNWGMVAPDGSELTEDELPAGRVLATGEPVVGQLVGVRRHDGHVLWLEVNAVGLTDGGEDLVVTTMRDATEVKLARDLDDALLAMSNRLAQASPGGMSGLLGTHLSGLGSAVDADDVRLVRLDRERGEAVVASSWHGPAGAGGPDHLPLDQLTWLLGALAGRRVLPVPSVDDLPAEAELVAELLRAWEVVAGLVARVVVGGRTWGFVVVSRRSPSPVTARSAGFVGTTCELLGAALARDLVHADLEARNLALDERVRNRSEALEREQARAEALVEAIPDHLVEIGADGRITAVHVGDPDSIVIPPARFVGSGVREVLGESFGAEVDEALDRLRAGSPVETLELVLEGPAAELRFECRIVSLPDGGFLALAREITDRAAQERRLREQSEALIRANEDLMRALRAKEEFLAMMSHELRTPIAALVGLAEVAAAEVVEGVEPDVGQLRGAVEAMGSSAARALTLVDDLLDLHGTQRVVDRLRAEPVAVDDVITGAASAMAAAAERGIALSVGPVAAATVIGDEERLVQAVVQLLANGVKFTPPGGSVGVTAEVAPGVDGDEVRIVVWDTGIGMDVADHERVFEPFTQLDSGTDRRFGGSGIGLALVDRVVRAHEGRIEVDSALGEGCRITLVLPAG